MLLVAAAMLVGPFLQAGVGSGAAGASPGAPTGPLAFPTTHPSTGGGILRFIPIEPGGRYGGVRVETEEGVGFNANIILDGFHNFAGGISTSKTQGSSWLDGFLALDTNKLLEWPGGLFATEMVYRTGDNPTATMVGDVQYFDFFNGPRYLELYQLWYQQKMADDAFRVRVGKIDANGEFGVVPYGLWFLNSAAQLNPTNYLLPTTPAPMPGITAFLQPEKWWYLGIGGFYSNTQSRFGNFVGPATSLDPARNGSYLIQEAALVWEHVGGVKAPGTFKAGTWQQIGVLPRLGGGWQRNAAGYYLIFSQTLWRPPGAATYGRGVGAFLQWGQNEGKVQPIYLAANGGVAWTGPFASRPDDVIGLAACYAGISPPALDRPKPQEVAFDMFYRILVNPSMAIQPDLQWIVTPGGRYDNALVLTLRLQINF